MRHTKTCAALTLYADDERGLLPKINTMLRQKNINAERGVAEHIAASCQGNGLVIQNEIEKIDLYLGLDNRNISLEDILVLTGNFAESNLQEICNCVISKKQSKTFYFASQI